MVTSALPPLSSVPIGYLTAYDGTPMKATAISFFIIQVLFVGLRFWSKSIGRITHGVDDYLVAVALLCCTGMDISALVSLRISGMGHHLVVDEETDPHTLVNWSKFLFILPLFYIPATVCARLAVLVAYHRIFVLGWARIATYVLMGLVIVSGVALLIADLLQCIPLNYLWDKSIAGTCFNIAAYDSWASILGACIDFLMLILPLPSIWGLHAPVKTRLGITVTLMTGSM